MPSYELSIVENRCEQHAALAFPHPKTMMSILSAFNVLMVATLSHCTVSSAQMRRFDMLALTDFQQASHRLQRTSSHQLFHNKSFSGDQFGSSLTSLGDIDKDGHSEFAVTSLNQNKTDVVLHVIRITPLAEVQLLATHSLFSYQQRTCITSVALIAHHTTPQLLTSLAVGAPLQAPAGAVFIITIDKNASLVTRPISLLPPHSNPNARFGASLAYVGDLNSDGHNDIVIGAPGESTMYVAFMDASLHATSFNPIRTSRFRRDAFASSMASVGDINDDGRMELIVSSSKNLYLVFLNRSGEISHTEKLDLPTSSTRSLGRSSALSFVGLDHADNIMFAIGNRYDNDGGTEKGAIWVTTIDTEGKVLRCVKFSELQGNLDGKLERGDHFGASLAATLDVNKDGLAELLVGVPRPPSTLTHLIKRGGWGLKDRPGQLWIIDVPGTRSVRVTKLEGMSPAHGCVYSQSTCTCSFRLQQKAKCLTLAMTTDDEGSLCHERMCSGSFECGKFKRLSISTLVMPNLGTNFNNNRKRKYKTNLPISCHSILIYNRLSRHRDMFHRASV